MLGRCDLVELELMVVVARKIRFRRNSVVHGGVFTHLIHLFRETSDSLDEFKRINAQEPDAWSHTLEVMPIQWKKSPATCMTKINWDVAVD